MNKLLFDLSETVGEYFNQIKGEISREHVNEAELNYFEEVISGWNNKIEKIKKYPEKSLASDIAAQFKYYSLLNSLFCENEELINIFNKYTLVYGEKSAQLNKINKIRAKCQQPNPADFAVAPPRSITNIDKFIEYFEELRESYDEYSLPLYAEITRGLLNYLEVAEDAAEDAAEDFRRQAIIYIENALEQDKTACIGVAVKSTSATNPQIKRFGLIPITISMPLKELVNRALQIEIKTAPNLNSIAKTYKCAIVLFKKIIYNPIEYSITKLFDESYFQNMEYGLTNKFIEKTFTIRDSGVKTKWNFDCELIDPHKLAAPESDAKIYIFETIDGVNYRALSLWVGSSIMYLQYNHLRELIDYLHSKKTLNRINGYHLQCQNIALRNMFLSEKMPIEIVQDEAKTVDSGTIRNEIFDGIMKSYGKIFRNKIKNSDDFIRTIQDPRIEEIFVDVILNLFAMTKNKELYLEDDSEFPTSELIVSYIAELQKISKGFTREINEAYTRAPLTEFTEENVRQKFERAVRDSLEYYISQRSNIYQAISYKKMLLSFR